MVYQEHEPSTFLRKYVKCYYTMACGPETQIEDKAFATGCLEVMFKLSGVPWQAKTHGSFAETANIDLWGQVLKPLTFKISGPNETFGIRFSPAAAALFFEDEISQFNDKIVDLSSVLGNSIKELYTRLQCVQSTCDRIDLVNAYLLSRFTTQTKALDKYYLVQQVMKELNKNEFFDTISNMAIRYGISARYLQKVFLLYTGLTPKLYSRINRFQNSLHQLANGSQSLTAIAYESGYYDQSHFIREFKSFTGSVPSDVKLRHATSVLASTNK